MLERVKTGPDGPESPEVRELRSRKPGWKCCGDLHADLSAARVTHDPENQPSGKMAALNPDGSERAFRRFQLMTARCGDVCRECWQWLLAEMEDGMIPT